MEKKPNRRRGISFFWLIFVVIAGAIAATVLFARDGYNYKRLLHALGIKLPAALEPDSPQRAAPKGKRLKGIAAPIKPVLSIPEVKGQESTFLRDINRDGEALCTALGRDGFKMSPWGPGMFSKKVFECWGEQTYSDSADPEKQSSFFVIVKGEPDGKLISARVKFVFNTAETRAKLVDQAVKTLTVFAERNHWGDLAEHVADIKALRPFSLDAFGLSVKFSSEFSGPGRYNLIFSRDAKPTASEKRTALFFNRSRFLPMRPEAGEYLHIPVKDAPGDKPQGLAKETR